MVNTSHRDRLTTAIPLPRRLVVGGIISIVALSAAEARGAAPATAAPQGLKVGPRGQAEAATTADVLTPIVDETGNGLRVPKILGGRIEGSPGLSRGTEITVRFDPRIYELASRPALTEGGRPLAVSPISVDQAPGAVTWRIDQDVAAGQVVVAQFGRLVVRSYPDDLIRQVAPVLLEVRSSDGKPLAAQNLSQPLVPQGLPWGVRLGVIWNEMVTEGASMWLPAVITMHSIGPGPIPAGSGLSLTAEPRLSRSLRLTPMDVEGVEPNVAKRGPLKEARWTLSNDVAPGERVSVAVAATADKTLRTLNESPVVQFLPPKKSTGWRRQTGLESISPEASYR